MPVWLVWYLGLLTAGYGLPLIGGMLLGGLMCFACYLICDDETPPRYGMSWILAILGFVVAATWIDTIANELVCALSSRSSVLKHADAYCLPWPLVRPLGQRAAVYGLGCWGRFRCVGSYSVGMGQLYWRLLYKHGTDVFCGVARWPYVVSVSGPCWSAGDGSQGLGKHGHDSIGDSNVDDGGRHSLQVVLAV
eukprot:scaffold2229_cov413-Prasinococcus_capsulatus_cf.AAC.11